MTANLPSSACEDGTDGLGAVPSLLQILWTGWLTTLDAAGGHDQTSWKMHFGGSDQAKLEEYLEVVDLDAVSWEGGATGADSIQSVTHNRWNVTIGFIFELMEIWLVVFDL